MMTLRYARRSGYRLPVLLLFWICLAGCGAPAAPNTSAPAFKNVTFAILEDYDKGEDLDEIAKDFALMKELGIDVLRCSLGWDDYEPERGRYDFAWLKDFVRLAEDHGIKLRPYIGYTPRWAGTPGSADGADWNNPPADYEAWYQFVYRLVDALRDYPNVLSYEIYNEENSRSWWDGSIDEYKETLRLGALAVRAVNPALQVLLGGAVFPDSAWLRQIVQNGYARYYDITPFHAYPETWIDSTVENYLDAGYRAFVGVNQNFGEAEPIWINEMGFAATPEKGEAEQANWWARAVSTFLADAHIEHLGVYEIKDLAPGKETIGDDKNYYLGLTRADRGKKLAFHTVALLNQLLAGKIAPADNEVSVEVINGKAGDLQRHLFKRADGRQVLFVYDKQANPMIEVKFHLRGARAWKYELNGTAVEYANFDGEVLRQIRLAAGNVAIFVIDP